VKPTAVTVSVPLVAADPVIVTYAKPFALKSPEVREASETVPLDAATDRASPGRNAVLFPAASVMEI